MNKYFIKYSELLFWITAIIFLVALNPEEGGHNSLCLFKFLGINFCPGCGLGRSMAWLLNGKLMASIQTHPLGIFALTIIFHRIYSLIKIHIYPPFKTTIT